MALIPYGGGQVAVPAAAGNLLGAVALANNFGGGLVNLWDGFQDYFHRQARRDHETSASWMRMLREARQGNSTIASLSRTIGAGPLSSSGMRYSVGGYGSFYRRRRRFYRRRRRFKYPFGSQISYFGRRRRLVVGGYYTKRKY